MLRNLLLHCRINKMAALFGIAALVACSTAGSAAYAQANGTAEAIDEGAIYQTYGVHNTGTTPPCAKESCEYPRASGEPANPVYPAYWVSDWTMYRVFNNYADNPPPFQGRPPAPLEPGVDYQTSFGTTYYDSTWRGESGEGAMMEYYHRYCLPIFPIPNDYTCAFISLGDTAYFVTYDDRPEWMPRVCLFSNFNHPPRRDFIKHLPYSAQDSARIGPGGQAYSFWVSHEDGSIMQVGASPDRTADGGILFAYGWDKQGDKVLPQSFYFSGVPTPVPNAPIVSQNYVNFSAEQPDPAQTWDLVAGLDPKTLPACQLFDPPKTEDTKGLMMEEQVPTWGTIGRGRRR